MWNSMEFIHNSEQSMQKRDNKNGEQLYAWEQQLSETTVNLTKHQIS